ncbi:MAG TPA: serine hydrolase [Gemmatimonadota bacterium]|nr:serine hydrolase [Gemmatimonadota bacterium]
MESVRTHTSPMRVSNPLARLCVLFLLTPAAALGQTSDTSPRVASLAARMPALIDSAGIPGLSMAVLHGGGTVWTEEYGVRNAVDRRPVGPETVFEAASLSKPVFAYGLLRLVDRGGFDLDRPLSEYVAMAQFGDDPRMDAVTARMILTHTSGISGFAEGGKVTMGSDPGTRFRYFGDAWLPLQRAVEAVTGEPVHEFLQREVLEPFGMDHSSFVWDDLEGDHATPHDEHGNPMEKRTFAEAHIAATLHTTAADYARFMAAAMKGTGLTAESAGAFMTPQVEVVRGVSWGLGVGLQDDARGQAFWQWGHWFGSRAYMIGYPETGDGLVFLANGDAGLSILDAVLGTVLGPDQPGAAWQGYEQFDSPARRARLELVRIFTDAGVDAGMARMLELERQAPAALTEEGVNALGYDLLGEGHFEAAIAVFRRNVERFPGSSNVYDSLGEAYLESGQLETALENYERSVELDPASEHGKAAIERIRQQLAGKP